MSPNLDVRPHSPATAYMGRRHLQVWSQIDVSLCKKKALYYKFVFHSISDEITFSQMLNLSICLAAIARLAREVQEYNGNVCS